MTWLRRLLVLEAAVLVATGIPLIWLYRPSTASDDLGDWLRVTHAVASPTFSWTALALVVAVVVQRTWRSQWPWAVGLFALAVALGFTGYLLPWDQLALWAVTIGTNIRGVLKPFSDEVRFVLVGGVEIGTDTYTRWVLVHILLLPLAGAGGLWFYRRRVGSAAHAADARDPHLRRDDALVGDGHPQPDT